MGSREAAADDRLRALDEEAERYRGAAVGALGQLEWIVEYLYKLQKVELAKALDRNRRQIQQRVT